MKYKGPFPTNIAAHFNCSLPKAITVHMILNDERKNIKQKMEECNKLLEMFGVEAIGHFSDFPCIHHFDYLNAGDTYAPTLVYCYHTCRFLLTSWGDMYERVEKRCKKCSNESKAA